MRFLFSERIRLVVLLAVTLALLGLFKRLLGTRATGVWSRR